QKVAGEKSRNNFVIAAGLLLIALLIIIFFLIESRRKTSARLELNQLNSKVLHAQLNPHFIFNALASVKNIIREHPEMASTYLSKFSALMRQVLENTREEKISLQEEIAMLENYMQLEALRLHNGFDYEIIIDKTVDAANTMIPPLILQPAVE